jgi:hypothetical protein
MPTPDEYRKIAETCYRLAREAKTEADRLALLDLAKGWLEAASREDTESVRERRRSWHARAASIGRAFDRPLRRKRRSVKRAGDLVALKLNGHFRDFPYH